MEHANLLPVVLAAATTIVAGVGTIVSFKKKEGIGAACCLAVFGLSSVSTALLYHFKDGIVL